MTTRSEVQVRPGRLRSLKEPCGKQFMRTATEQSLLPIQVPPGSHDYDIHQRQRPRCHGTFGPTAQTAELERDHTQHPSTFTTAEVLMIATNGWVPS